MNKKIYWFLSENKKSKPNTQHTSAKSKFNCWVNITNKYIDFYDFTQNGSAQEIKHFWELVNDVINKKNISDSGFRLITNSGKDGNQDVPHFHVHLLGGKNLGKMIN